MKRQNEYIRRASLEDRLSVGELQVRIRQLEHYSRRDNIEISEIPSRKQENAMALVSGAMSVLLWESPGPEHRGRSAPGAIL